MIQNMLFQLVIWTQFRRDVRDHEGQNFAILGPSHRLGTGFSTDGGTVAGV